MTLSIKALSIMTSSVMQRVIYPECPDFHILMLSVIMLSVVLLNVVLLSALMLSVIMLSVVLSVEAPS
jgi:hypothetical protein